MSAPPSSSKPILLARYRKAIPPLLGIAAEVITQYYPHATWEAPVIATLTLIGVILVPNARHD